MNASLLLNNIVAYSLQIGMLVGLAGFIPVLLRLRQPGARLAYWHILLAACLLLPLVRPWRQEAVTTTVQVTTTVAAVHPHTGARSLSLLPPLFRMGKSGAALMVLAVGFLIRLAWLAIGFWRLRRYRHRAIPLDPAPSWGVEASLRISPDVSSPVTFGWLNPVVLLPSAFPALDRSAQEAILCHEVLHVRRGDWLFMVAEEFVRALFWFHPAIWWLLGEVGLAREQEVDRQAIGITKEREEYMDALLAIAGSRAQMDLAPAPLFLRKRHLKQRVVLILKETRMSKTRLISALAAGVMMLAAACWLTTGMFPLMASPQLITDSPGVSVDLRGATVMHRSSVPYPAAALQQRVQGILSVEVKLDPKGNVADAHVLSGPDELRKAALESVLQWHFTRDSAGTTRVVQISFELPKDIDESSLDQAARPGVIGGVVGGVPGGVVGGVSGGVVRGVVGGIVGSVPAVPPPHVVAPGQSVSVTAPVPLAPRPTTPCTIKSISVSGLPEQVNKDLMAQLEPYQGGPCSGMTPDFAQTVKLVDEHLQIRTRPVPGTNDLEVQVVAPGSVSSIKVGGNVQSALILRKVQPVYPALAKSARVEGTVRLAIIIAKDGTIQEMHSIGGPALLIQSAMDAVRQWVYRPTFLNGEPVTVDTTVDIVFSLEQ